MLYTTPGGVEHDSQVFRAASVIEGEDKLSLATLALSDEVPPRPCLPVGQHELGGVGTGDHPVEPVKPHQLAEILGVLLGHGPRGVRMGHGGRQSWRDSV